MLSYSIRNNSLLLTKTKHCSFARNQQDKVRVDQAVPYQGVFPRRILQEVQLLHRQEDQREGGNQPQRRKVKLRA